ncbi:MAG: UDP-N-acetylmuramate--L-alanine ligase [Candidatus Nealsonbacteria bacterium]|nr:UDP-N-acetylmuramate--L-alanine ligase [Candidatus Nealsonbacteria bacterium]
MQSNNIFNKISQSQRRKQGVHFIGIGGIGVSALAQYYLAMGHKISGSDLASSEITELLRKKGAEIFITNPKSKIQNPKLQSKIKNADLVIYSPAVRKDHPELLAASRYKLETMSYPQALGELTKKYFTIAVSGTHGKSTTTAMIALILVKSGLDPAVIVGTKLKEFGNSNFRTGKSKYLAIEADEHMASFLNYWPKIIVLTNIDKDHLDYYKNLKNILKSFKKYVSHLSKDGVLVANKDDINISKLKTQISKLQFKTQNYSLKQREANILRRILKIPGEHNVSNALAALTTARVLCVPDKISFKALSEFRGSWRRFEERHITWNKKYLTIVSDYAHHPTEVLATLKAARKKYPKKRIWCVFQPHQYQRTHYLFKDFIKVFKEALTYIDRVIITDIYDVAGRENKEVKKKVSGKKLVEAVRKPKAIYLPKDSVLGYAKDNFPNRGVLVIMGAGDIYMLGR